jgi:hypothetical protein
METTWLYLFRKPRYNVVAGTAGTAVRSKHQLMAATKLSNLVDALTRNYWVTARDCKSPADSKLFFYLSITS